MLRSFSVKFYISLLVIFFHFLINAFAQEPKQLNAAEIQVALNKLTVLGSALYVAAHPDDENTRLIAYLSKEKLANTAYFSFTRGDGGQNLIGTEIGSSLGLIRTQELLEARKIDGGKQFFSRAKDFGFSKHPEETFTLWDKEAVLADLVLVIRRFKPDVVITRFNTTPGTTHGHHTASAILAEEAFTAAADKNRFPEQLKYVDVWQPSNLFWNTSSWFFEENKFDTLGLVSVDVGNYNAPLGKSYTELAAESRSMHKSQGFGSSGVRGATKEYLQPLKGVKNPKELFQGVNISWSRVKGGEKIGSVLKKAADNFDANNPTSILPILLEANKMIKALPDGHWKSIKLNEMQQVIEACLGLYVEALASDYSVGYNDSLKIDVEAVNRSSFPVKLQKVSYSISDTDSLLNIDLKRNKVVNFNKKLKITKDLPLSQPYWLREEGTVGMYNVEDHKNIGKPENDPAITVKFEVLIGDHLFLLERPVVYKKTDPVHGEQYRQLEVIPPVFVNIKEQVMIFASDDPKVLEVIVEAGKPGIKGEAKLKLPAGWKAEPESFPVVLAGKGEEVTVRFYISPPSSKSTDVITARVELNGEEYINGYQSIVYPHITNQLLMPEAHVKVSRLDIKKRGESIGYIMGAGDEIPLSLQQIGYNVTLLDEADITINNLKRFDAIILGIRAYNTIEKLKFFKTTLFDYVKQGGNLIVQYNTTGGLLTKDIAPFPLTLSRDRVAVEDAPVRIIKPNHPVLNKPNKITSEDFESWVQERGLYFASEWDPNFQPLISINDPEEEPKEGSLLVAQYGEGFYVYTGLSFFRQLTAGVPGAYRLFANLISLEKD